MTDDTLYASISAQKKDKLLKSVEHDKIFAFENIVSIVEFIMKISRNKCNFLL